MSVDTKVLSREQLLELDSLAKLYFLPRLLLDIKTIANFFGVFLF